MNKYQSKDQNYLPIWPAVFLAYSLCVPEQIFFSIGNFIMFPYRIILIFMIPRIVSAYSNRIVRGNFADLAVLAAMVWIVVALSIMIGFDKAMANGGASALDVGISYFTARCTMTSGARAREFLVKIGPIFLVVGLSILLETLSGKYIFQPFIAKLVGVDLSRSLFTSVSGRLGLIRGTGPFSHPILGGLQLASLLPIYLLANLKFVRKGIGTVAAILSLATVSSSAVLALALSGILVGYEVIRTHLKFLTWKGLVTGVAVVAVGLQIFTQGGIVGIVVNFMTLDKWTAYYRTLVWKYGAMNVAMHPWFGIGLEEWIRPSWMPESIDNYWLYLAMSYGVPEAVLRISLPIIAAFIAAGGMIRLNQADRRIVLGYTITVIVMTLMAFTVAFWGVTQAWYYFLIGSTVSLAENARYAQASARTVPDKA